MDETAKSTSDASNKDPAWAHETPKPLAALSEFTVQAVRMCEFPNPHPLLFRISRLAYAIGVGREEAAKGGRAFESVFYDLENCIKRVHEEATKAITK